MVALVEILDLWENKGLWHSSNPPLDPSMHLKGLSPTPDYLELCADIQGLI